MWSKPVILSEYGLSPIAGIASYSSDCKYIFFNVAGDIYWISSEFVELSNLINSEQFMNSKKNSIKRKKYKIRT